jgi:Ca2+-binding EF-hand superfamily protein
VHQLPPPPLVYRYVSHNTRPLVCFCTTPCVCVVPVVFTDQHRYTIQVTYAGLAGQQHQQQPPVTVAVAAALEENTVSSSRNDDDDESWHRNSSSHDNKSNNNNSSKEIDDVIKVGWIAHELLTGIANPMDEGGLDQSTLLTTSALSFLRDLLQRNGRCSVQRALQHDWLITTTTTTTGNLAHDVAVSAIPPPMEHRRRQQQQQLLLPTAAAAEMATVIQNNSNNKKDKKESKMKKHKNKQVVSVKIPLTPPPPDTPRSLTTPATAAMTPESCGTMTRVLDDDDDGDDRAEERCHFVNSPISIVDADPAEETTTTTTTRTFTTRATRSSTVNEMSKKQQPQQSRRTNLDDFLSSTSSNNVVPDEFKALREAFDDLKSAHTDVTAKDLKAILRQRKKYTEEEVETWFNRANLVEDSRQVKFTELLTEAIHSRRRVERARVAEAFQHIDKDRQGFVTVGNLRAILGTKNSDYIEILIKEADQKRDGRIRYAVFQEVLNFWNEREESGSLL